MAKLEGNLSNFTSQAFLYQICRWACGLWLSGHFTFKCVFTVKPTKESIIWKISYWRIAHNLHYLRSRMSWRHVPIVGQCLKNMFKFLIIKTSSMRYLPMRTLSGTFWQICHQEVLGFPFILFSNTLSSDRAHKFLLNFWSIRETSLRRCTDDKILMRGEKCCCFTGRNMANIGGQTSLSKAQFGGSNLLTTKCRYSWIAVTLEQGPIGLMTIVFTLSRVWP